MSENCMSSSSSVMKPTCGVGITFGCDSRFSTRTSFRSCSIISRRVRLSTPSLRLSTTLHANLVAPPRSRLLKSGPIARETVLEFFDVCNAKMNTMRFRDALNAHWRATKTPPNQLIIDAQRGVLEALGVEKEHGCQRLSGIQRDFPNDQEVHTKMQIWMHTAQETCHQIVNDDTDGMQMYLMKNYIK